MPRISSKQTRLALISAVLAKLADDEPIRQDLPGGGRLRFDRRLPFVCVYRGRVEGADLAIEELIEEETAYLILPSEPKAARQGIALLRAIVENLATHFGSFLLVEIWPARDVQTQPAPPNPTRNGSPLKMRSPIPIFEIITPATHTPRRAVESLSKSLSKIQISQSKTHVAITHRRLTGPPGMKPLLTTGRLAEWNSFALGLAIAPIYRDAKTGDVRPAVLRTLRRGVNTSLKHAFFSFTHRRANVRPAHYYALGQRSIVKEVFEIDHQLAAISRSFDLLLQATPVNAEDAWRDFRRSRFEKPPVFYYRPLALDPMLLKRELYTIPVERVEDPTLSFLFRQKQEELDRQITLLTDVDSPRFLPESVQIYGGVSGWLLAQANELLGRVPTRSRDDSTRDPLNAVEFARRAEAEFSFYRKQCPTFSATASVRDDLYVGLLVSADQLLIGARTCIAKSRVDALLQHEVGTHLVTRYNGRQQPFKQLEVGLAGYDGLQEGLAVLAEYLVGGLSAFRIRVLAARVVAARQLLDGATFVETFRSLARTFEFSQRSAYTIAMRTFRGGGLTKDAVYLRGLLQILKYLKDGGELEPLYIGKVAAAHLPLIAELRIRQVIKPPTLRPRYLDEPPAAKKIKQLREGLTILQLLD